MQPTLVDEPATGGATHEVKHDGYRRRGRQAGLPIGDTCVLDAEGRSDFGELRRAIHARGNLVFSPSTSCI
jgi:ATP-dependent DNA ligase